MTNPVLIAPSLLSADFSRLDEDIRRVEEAGADLLHLDIMDGHFVPNLSYGIPVVEAVRRVTDLKLDTHLMIDNPLEFLEPFRDAGADSLTLHLEACPQPAPLIEEIHRLGMECGLAVNPDTPVAGLLPFVADLDLVLIMSVQPGFGGQEFRPEVLPKLVALSTWMAEHDHHTALEIDGGVTADNASLCRGAGARLLVAGSSVFGAPDAAAAITALRGDE